jgi:hypothetical protein
MTLAFSSLLFGPFLPIYLTSPPPPDPPAPPIPGIEPRACWVSALPLELHPQPLIFLKLIFFMSFPFQSLKWELSGLFHPQLPV